MSILSDLFHFSEVLVAHCQVSPSPPSYAFFCRRLIAFSLPPSKMILLLISRPCDQQVAAPILLDSLSFLLPVRGKVVSREHTTPRMCYSSPYKMTISCAKGVFDLLSVLFPSFCWPRGVPLRCTPQKRRGHLVKWARPSFPLP